MRSQINSQILVYILAVIIMAIVLLFGYKAIRDMMSGADTVELLTFKSDINTGISKLSTQYETTKFFTFKVPAGFRELCFVDLDFGTRPNGNVPTIPDSYALIKNVVPDMLTNSVDPKNLFLCPKCTDQLYVGNIILKNQSDPDRDYDFLCFPVKKGFVKLSIKGRGNGVTISLPSN
jgi:hypothetical protein